MTLSIFYMILLAYLGVGTGYVVGLIENSDEPWAEDILDYFLTFLLIIFWPIPMLVWRKR